MSVISATTDFIKDYSGLESGAPFWTNFLKAQTKIQYNIVPLAGPRKMSEYISGGGDREFLFAFQSTVSTLDEIERMDTVEFFEAFAEWLDEQDDAENYPSLDAGYEAYKIEAVGAAYLFEAGPSGIGVHQIQCRLLYTKT